MLYDDVFPCFVEHGERIIVSNPYVSPHYTTGLAYAARCFRATRVHIGDCSSAQLLVLLMM